MSDLNKWRLLFLTATGSADRMSPRHVFETRIGTGLHRDSQRLTLEGWSRDLREGSRGAFVALVLGKFVTLEIPLPDSDKQVIPMRLARALGTGVERCATHADSGDAESAPGVPYHRMGR